MDVKSYLPYFRALFIALIAFTFFYSCQKNDPFELKDHGHSKKTKPYVFNTEDLASGLVSSADLTKTVIKKSRQNPYTVENIKASYEAVIKSQYLGQSTHKYVLFTPSSATELDILNDEDLLLLDYPWTSEVVQAGKYYYEPRDSNDIPPLYTIVSNGFIFPNGIEYKVIDELDLADYSAAVMEEAYDRTQNKDFFEDSYKTLKRCEEGGGPIVIDEPEVCGPTGGGGGGGQFMTNDCGCEIFRDVRKPGGCVRVDDTHLNAIGDVNNFTGVRRIRVYARDGWFKLKKTYTDDNGCWRVNSRFSGNGWFYFRLKSENRGKIRSTIMGYPAVTGAVRLTTGKIAGPVFHDIQVNVSRRGTAFTSTGVSFIDDIIENKIFEIWSGCMINNALHEFHDFAAAEGIAAPPSLNILVNGKQTRGFASMLRQMGESDFLDAVSSGFINADTGNDLVNVLRFAGGLLGRVVTDLTFPISYPAMRTYVGDVTIGADFFNSDEIKRLAYHELGHTSHFQTAGEDYWQDVIRSVVKVGGHGNEFGPDADFISLFESWPEHLALSILAERYGGAALFNLPSSGDLFLSWNDRLEFIHNESANHVAIGVYNDLIDPRRGVNGLERTFDENVNAAVGVGNITETDARFFFRRNVRDEVTGFSNQLIGQNLTSSTRSIADLNTIMIANPMGNNPLEIQALFNDY